MFVCGGENIYPGDVEKMLERHPGVHQACVVPAEDAVRGNKPVAYVVVAPGPPADRAEGQGFCPRQCIAQRAPPQCRVRRRPSARGHQQDRSQRARPACRRVCRIGLNARAGGQAGAVEDAAPMRPRVMAYTASGVLSAQPGGSSAFDCRHLRGQRRDLRNQNARGPRGRAVNRDSPRGQFIGPFDHRPRDRMVDGGRRVAGGRGPQRKERPPHPSRAGRSAPTGWPSCRAR